jgi:hypothetical protein
VLEREIISYSKPSSRTLEAFRNIFNDVDGKDKKDIPRLGRQIETLLTMRMTTCLCRSTMMPTDQQDFNKMLSRLAVLFTVKTLH